MKISLESPSIWRIAKICLIFLVLFAVTVLLGLDTYNQQTDLYSENCIIVATRNMLQGNQRYGITTDTHYPNGPAYFLLPFMALTKQIYVLRMFPLMTAAASVGAFFTLLLFRSRNAVATIMVLLTYVAICAQPGMARWWGALHEHSHQMYAVFLIILFGYARRRVWIAFPVLGFICGWIGYDFLPAQVITMFVIRYIVHSRSEGWVTSCYRAFLESLAGGAAVLLAILTHLIQNTLFFGSFAKAWKDLIGAAEGRCALDQLSNLDPNYIQHLKNANQNRPFPGRFAILAAHWKVFNDSRFGFWYSRPILLNATLFSCWALSFLVVWLKKSGWLKFLVDSVTVVLCSGLASATWILLMKYHAYFHFHFVPRLFLVAYLNVFVFLIVASNQRFGVGDLLRSFRPQRKPPLPGKMKGASKGR